MINLAEVVKKLWWLWKKLHCNCVDFGGRGDGDILKVEILVAEFFDDITGNWSGGININSRRLMPLFYLFLPYIFIFFFILSISFSWYKLKNCPWMIVR